MRFRYRGDPRRARTRPLGGLVVCALLLAGCGNGPRVHLHVCGDVRVPDDVDALGVTLLDADRNPVYDGTQDLFTPSDADGGTAGVDGGSAGVDGGTGGGGAADAGTSDGGAGAGSCVIGQAANLPLSFDLRDGHGDMWVVVQAFKQGAPVATIEARVSFPTQGAADVSVGLTRDCLGVKCAFGQTCVKGICQVTEFGGTPAACEGAAATGPVKAACEPSDGGSP